MKKNHYGSISQNNIQNDVERYSEEISIKGFATVPNLISEEELEIWRRKIDEIYIKQEESYGKNALLSIDEIDMCRAPLLYDIEFMKLASNPLILQIAKNILGSWIILNLQNAIINRPKQKHHQSSWHRDLPYQNFVISKPLAINALFAIDEFSNETGSTQVVPYSHRLEVLPSDDFINTNSVDVVMPQGSVVLFDSMIFHRAGYNNSKITRRAINHMYTIPLLKQQYDLPRALGGNYSFDREILQLLGYSSQVPLNEIEWRKNRENKILTQIGSNII